eukprot:m.41150 g.41150  ORF g.41150 m.41150 type:complete len:364 (-) comp10521_c0_seq3:293-1384(-)
MGLMQVLVCALVATCAMSVVAQKKHYDPSGFVHRMHSVNQPYLAADMVVPHWDFIGNTVITDDYIRLTPDRQSKRGALWNLHRMGETDWEVMIEFKVHGQAKALAGDGFAFWYTRERNQLGEVFGSRDKFTGLGIFFDTYSNRQLHHRTGAYISAMVNDGTLEYDHDMDGTHEEVGSCQAALRNLDFTSRARITYKSNTLKVELDVDNENEWQLCFFQPEIYLPSDYFIGVSAATGDLADNHDIISLITATPAELSPDELEQKRTVEEKDRSLGLNLPTVGEEIKKPWAAHHAAARKHVGPRKTFSFSKVAKEKAAERQAQEAASQPSSFWLYFILIVVFVGGVAGVIYKVKVLDKKSPRFDF